MFVPNSRHRAWVTPARRGKGNKARKSEEPPTPSERRASTTRAQRPKRVFNIGIETCQACGGPVRIIACIEVPAVIEKILAHLMSTEETRGPSPFPESRALQTGEQAVLFH